MKKLKRDRIAFLSLFISSLVLFFAGCSATVLFAFKINYPAVIISVIISLYGIYSFPFWLIAYRNRVWVKRLILKLGEGESTENSAAELGIKEQYAEKLLKMSEKHGYIEK